MQCIRQQWPPHQNNIIQYNTMTLNIFLLNVALIIISIRDSTNQLCYLGKCIKLIGLRLGIIGESLWMRHWTSSFHKLWSRPTSMCFRYRKETTSVIIYFMYFVNVILVPMMFQCSGLHIFCYILNFCVLLWNIIIQIMFIFLICN